MDNERPRSGAASLSTNHKTYKTELEQVLTDLPHPINPTHAHDLSVESALLERLTLEREWLLCGPMVLERVPVLTVVLRITVPLSVNFMELSA